MNSNDPWYDYFLYISFMIQFAPYSKIRKPGRTELTVDSIF